MEFEQKYLLMPTESCPKNDCTARGPHYHMTPESQNDPQPGYPCNCVFYKLHTEGSSVVTPCYWPRPKKGRMNQVRLYTQRTKSVEAIRFSERSLPRILEVTGAIGYHFHPLTESWLIYFDDTGRGLMVSHSDFLVREAPDKPWYVYDGLQFLRDFEGDCRGV